ncbi:hypothetical protein, partial [Chromobacterium amazonense]|uniref:hypothetical protein n=1 Tax=Chromobacterium amazonense TaxID=1382803 RepID=UPI001CB94865
SYRSVYRFIDVRWDWLRQHTGLNWRRKPCYTALYTILRGIDAAALEQALRQQAAQLTAPTQDERLCAIALDGKTLRGSLDQAALPLHRARRHALGHGSPVRLPAGHGATTLQRR